MGFDDKFCDICTREFIKALTSKIAKTLFIVACEKNITTPKVNTDCDFCRNANTCDELNHDNDLSYIPCGSTDEKTRLLFKSGDARPTELLVERRGEKRWELIGHFTPNYCPFCGRLLFENMKTKENRNG